MYRLKLFPAVVFLALMVAMPAHAKRVTADFSGSWFDPDASGQGLVLEVLRGNKGNQGLVYWYTFDDEGNPLWALGVGRIFQNTVTVDMETAHGPDFENFDPQDLVLTYFATITLTFDSCDTGTLEWEGPGIGTGELNLIRLTELADSSCSGGISDDIAQDDEDVEIRVPLENTGIIASAEGHAKFEQTPTDAEFKVEIEGVAAGSYGLHVAGIAVGDIIVDESGEGEIEFESPADDDDLLLDFDPRGELIEVLDGGDVILTALFEATAEDDGPPAHAGREEIEIELTSTSLFADASGDAEYERRGMREEFEVEIEDVAEGDYTLLVGGIERGTIEVITVSENATEGEIEFRAPGAGNKLLLDFDPRGQLIEIVHADGLVLSGEFPDEGSSDDEDDDGEDG